MAKTSQRTRTTLCAKPAYHLWNRGKPLTPALSPSEGEREDVPPTLGVSRRFDCSGAGDDSPSPTGLAALSRRRSGWERAGVRGFCSWPRKTQTDKIGTSVLDNT